MAPVTAMLVMLSVALPVFVKVTFCAGLVVLIVWLANVKLAGDRLTTGVEGPLPAANVTIAPAQVVEGQVAVAL